LVRLLPEQIQILRDVLGSVGTRITATLGLSPEVVDTFLSKAVEFVNRAQPVARDRPYAISLALSEEGGDQLSMKTFAASLAAGRCCFQTDLSLRSVNATAESTLLSDCTQRSEDISSLVLQVQGGYVYYILRGKLIAEGNVVHPGAAPQSSSRWHRPIRDLELLVGDHMHEDVQNERGFHYWQNKDGRILLHGRDGTEVIFQLPLFRWLSRYVYDGLEVYAEPSGLGQDKTDINIVTESGRHVVEVKWLGKNERGATYRESRIGEGLRQVKIYLDNDDKLVAGYLVVYDARPAAENSTKCQYADADLHAMCARPMIHFLESVSPSIAAKATSQSAGRS